VADFCKHGNEPGYIKGEECFDHLSDCQIRKKASLAFWICWHFSVHIYLVIHGVAFMRIAACNENA
jgi:hypothetical protein